MSNGLILLLYAKSTACISTSVRSSHILAQLYTHECKFSQKRYIMKIFSMLLAVSAMFVLLTLSGCGQTGPLYLPDETEKAVKK
jgi:hypothetical protein